MPAEIHGAGGAAPVGLWGGREGAAIAKGEALRAILSKQ